MPFCVITRQSGPRHAPTPRYFFWASNVHEYLTREDAEDAMEASRFLGRDNFRIVEAASQAEAMRQVFHLWPMPEPQPPRSLAIRLWRSVADFFLDTWELVIWDLITRPGRKKREEEFTRLYHPISRALFEHRRSHENGRRRPFSCERCAELLRQQDQLSRDFDRRQ